MFICVALTGLRAGELLGLKWKHVGLENGELRVEQSLWNKQVVTPKTRSSKDSVWFDAKLTQVLAEHRQNSSHTAQRTSSSVGRMGHRSILTFSAGMFSIRLSIGSVFHESKVLPVFMHFVTLPEVSWKRGLDVSSWRRGSLRHSNVSTTADIYTHVTKQGEREAAIALEGAYFGDLFPVVPNSGNGNKKRSGQLKWKSKRLKEMLG